MPGEFGGPSPEEMGIKSKTQYDNLKSEALVKRTLALAEQLGGNKLRPELVEALEEAKDLADPMALDALDPDSQMNQKHLSPQARGNLARAWETFDKMHGTK